MPSEESAGVRIELEAAVDAQGTISGRLRAASAAEWRSFSGWMDLAGGLVDVVDPRASGDPPQ